MKVQDAMNSARLDAIRANYERLSQEDGWSALIKDQKYAKMTIECGLSRQALMPYLKELNIEL